MRIYRKGNRMDDPDLKTRATAVRIKRMKKSLGWSVLASMMLDIFARAIVSEGKSTGTNLLFFVVIAVAIYYSMKPAILRGDAASFAWRGKAPWLLVYWSLAGALILLLFTRFL